MLQKHFNRDLLSSSEKCFMALELLNAVGPMKISELAPRLGTPRTTAVRILRTLSARGYVARGKDNKFRVSDGVNRLSVGYKPAEMVLPRIENILADHAREFMWPLAMALPRPDAMYSCITTDELTPFKMFSNPAGTRLPYFGTASGTVYLAFCSANERTAIFRLARSDPHSKEVDSEEVDAAIKLASNRGYCFMNRWKIGSKKDRELYSRDGAIAIPLLNDELAFGSLATRFINAAVKPVEIERNLVPKMREVAALIEAEWQRFRASRAARVVVT